MLDLAVGAVAAILVLIGAAIIAGPALTRRVWKRPSLGRRRAWRPRPSLPRPSAPEAGVHPTTEKAIIAASRISTLLRMERLERQATDVRLAAKRLRVDEANGLYAMQTAIRELRGVELEDREAARRLRQLLEQLQASVRDRAEQLELLPF
jgi:hypothetical protein